MKRWGGNTSCFKWQQKTEGFKAFCFWFGLRYFCLLVLLVNFFFFLHSQFPITYQDMTAEICTLKNMLINVISDSRFYFFYTSCICNDPDMHSSYQILQIQRWRASFYLLARTYEFLIHFVPYLPWLWKAFK